MVFDQHQSMDPDTTYCSVALPIEGLIPLALLSAATMLRSHQKSVLEQSYSGIDFLKFLTSTAIEPMLLPERHLPGGNPCMCMSDRDNLKFVEQVHISFVKCSNLETTLPF